MLEETADAMGDSDGAAVTASEACGKDGEGAEKKKKRWCKRRSGVSSNQTGALWCYASAFVQSAERGPETTRRSPTFLDPASRFALSHPFAGAAHIFRPRFELRAAPRVAACPSRDPGVFTTRGHPAFGSVGFRSTPLLRTDAPRSLAAYPGGGTSMVVFARRPRVRAPGRRPQGRPGRVRCPAWVPARDDRFARGRLRFRWSWPRRVARSRSHRGGGFARACARTSRGATSRGDPGPFPAPRRAPPRLPSHPSARRGSRLGSAARATRAPARTSRSGRLARGPPRLRLNAVVVLVASRHVRKGGSGHDGLVRCPLRGAPHRGVGSSVRVGAGRSWSVARCAPGSSPSVSSRRCTWVKSIGGIAASDPRALRGARCALCDRRPRLPRSLPRRMQARGPLPRQGSRPRIRRVRHQLALQAPPEHRYHRPRRPRKDDPHGRHHQGAESPR